MADLAELEAVHRALVEAMLAGDQGQIVLELTAFASAVLIVLREQQEEIAALQRALLGRD